MPRIGHNEAVMLEIQSALNAGKEVITHTAAVSVPGWSGEVYIVRQFRVRRWPLSEPLGGDAARAGGKFSPFWALLRQFEIISVIGTEEDLIGSRIRHRNEDVYLYDTVATPDQAQALFRAFVTSINGVAAHPQFYNTLLNNCANAVTRHIEAISEKRFPWWDYRMILPGYAVELALEMGLIPAAESLEQLRAEHRISDKGDMFEGRKFSENIRSY